MGYREIPRGIVGVGSLAEKGGEYEHLGLVAKQNREKERKKNAKVLI